ncbi:MAG: sensor domain-containing diguanylate cyclase [Desulfobacca sp.]|uniref:sensor domain-containing diguanylate cyclase n=1 Tax=Desulfobacca sp. TaxID=2067990 RepID=UPI004049D0BB
MAIQGNLLAEVDNSNQLQRLLTCFELSKTLVSTFDLEALMRTMVEKFNELIPARNWSILLLDPEAQELRFFIVVGLEADKVQQVRLKVGEGIAGTVAQTRKPIFIQDVRNCPKFCPKVDEQTGFETKSIICLPLQVRGDLIGVLEVVNIENEIFFLKNYLPLLNILADYIAIALDNIRSFEDVQKKSFVDDLTGYYNTRYLAWTLDSLVQKIMQEGSCLSVVFLDLDNFKQVVDTHGHLLGSKVLVEVAHVIGGLLAPGDSLIRYGGDEFIILLPHRDKAAAYDFVCHLRQAVNQSGFLCDEGINLTITASYGIATLPEDARDKTGLLKLADVALFASKDRGKDTIMMGADLQKEAAENVSSRKREDS